MMCAAASAADFGVLPSDRMAMADRLFDRGSFAEAKAEYVSLLGAEGIAPDELLYRLAETERSLGNTAAARARFSELVAKHPNSRHAGRARLSCALTAPSEAEKRAGLKALDNDMTPADVRAAALYNLGSMDNDADAFERAAAIDPKGRYAVFARLRAAQIRATSEDATVRRKAFAELLRLHYLPDSPVASDALYLAATVSYAEKRYGEASSVLRRYEKLYPGDGRSAEVRRMHAWSEFLAGKYVEAAALCGEGGTDDTDYLLAASAYSSGDFEKAKALFEKYLAAHVDGRYRKASELPLARMAFEKAGRTDDMALTIEAAKRSASLSHDPADRMRLAWAYEKAGRDDEAAAEYASIARDNPGADAASEALFRKALVDIRASRWSAAELALAESLSISKTAPHKAESLYWRGVCANMLGHDAEAEVFLRQALELGLTLDQGREARLMIADHLFKEDKLSEAKTAYAALVREGAAERMPTSKLRAIGRFLLSDSAPGPMPSEAEKCGKAIVANGGTPEWRQSGYALEGAAREAAGRFTEAAASYRAAMAEPVRTEDACEVALALGVLEAKAGLWDEADVVLREAVKLNSNDNARRATAYLWLAKNSFMRGDRKNAAAYATVVSALFDDAKLAAEAQSIIDKCGEEGKGL